MTDDEQVLAGIHADVASRIDHQVGIRMNGDYLWLDATDGSSFFVFDDQGEIVGWSCEIERPDGTLDDSWMIPLVHRPG